MMKTIALALGLAACAVPVAASAQDAAQAPSASSSRKAIPGYALGVGDSVRVTVYGEPTLSGEFKITDTGDISYPLIGNIKAEGKGLVAIQDEIQARLRKGLVKDAAVSVEMVAYRPFYILGEVNKPGEYAYRVGIYVDQAVAAAGGYSYRGNTKEVWLRRADEEREHKVKLRGEAPVRVMPGDTIRVGERYF